MSPFQYAARIAEIEKKREEIIAAHPGNDPLSRMVRRNAREDEKDEKAALNRAAGFSR